MDNKMNGGDVLHLFDEKTQSKIKNIFTDFSLNILIKKKTNIVLSGGGIKGIAHVGALHRFTEYGFNFNEIAAASCGAFVGVLYVLGYSPSEMYEFVKMYDFNKLKDINALKFLDSYGLDNGHKLELMIKHFITNKNYSENITLAELQKTTGKSITLTSVCVNDRAVIYLSHITYPNLELWKALRMSMALPGYYAPVKMDGKYYVDGGVGNNYPMNVFKDALDNTVGVYLDNASDTVDINDIETYGMRVMQCLIESANYATRDMYNEYTVRVHFDNTGAVDFDLPLQVKINVFESGYNGVRQFLENIAT